MFAAQARGLVLHTCYVMLEGCTLSQMLGMVNTEVRRSGGGGGCEHEAAGTTHLPGKRSQVRNMAWGFAVYKEFS